MKRLTALSMFVLLVFYTASSFAAQSTADVTASEELKQSAREEILGPRSGESTSQKEYIIGHGDILGISIYGEGGMSASAGGGEQGGGAGVRVMMDGRISLKHIGDVEVVDMTLTELADYLKKLYSTIYDDPIITTTLMQSNSLRYTMMGNVGQPGNFLMESPLTLVQAIARSGGFTEWANHEMTVVREKLNAEDKQKFKGNTFEFDYDNFITGKAPGTNIPLQSGDIIIAH